MTAAEAAKIAGVSRQYMHSLVPTFKSASRLGGFLVFKRKEIEAWVANRPTDDGSESQG